MELAQEIGNYFKNKIDIPYQEFVDSLVYSGKKRTATGKSVHIGGSLYDKHHHYRAKLKTLDIITRTNSDDGNK